jgi:hypothetical protein
VAANARVVSSDVGATNVESLRIYIIGRDDPCSYQ